MTVCIGCISRDRALLLFWKYGNSIDWFSLIRALDSMGEEFALSELQNEYECWLGCRVDKRNFRKKLISTKVIQKTTGEKTVNRGRPATLWTRGGVVK